MSLILEPRYKLTLSPYASLPWTSQTETIVSSEQVANRLAKELQARALMFLEWQLTVARSFIWGDKSLT
jgi:hypothetical protein